MKEFLRKNHYLILGTLMGVIADAIGLNIGNGGAGISTGDMVIIIFAGLVADDFAKRLNNKNEEE